MTEIEEKIVSKVDRGIIFKDIANELEMGYDEVLAIKRKLAEEGILTRKRIVQGKDRRKREEMENDKIVLKILEYRKSEITMKEISKKILEEYEEERTTGRIQCIIRDAIRLGIIDSEELNSETIQRVQEEETPQIAKQKEQQEMSESVTKVEVGRPRQLERVTISERRREEAIRNLRMRMEREAREPKGEKRKVQNIKK